MFGTFAVVERYSHPSVQYYHQLLFDVHNYQLIVGARYVFLVFSLRAISVSKLMDGVWT